MMNLEVIGNLGSDAEMRNENGKKFILFSVAHTDSYTREDGSRVENTTWVNCILNGDGGNLVKYLKRGTQVFVRGRQSVRVYSSAKDRCMKAGVDVNVREIELVGGKADDVPAQLVDKNGVIHEVYKAYYLLADGDGAFPVSNLQPTRGRGLFACDENGFVTPVADGSGQSSPSAENASDNNLDVNESR